MSGSKILAILYASFTEFPVRLGKNKSTEGLVEVFFGGLWGTVGTDKWDLRDALVLCRQLGFGQIHRTYQREVSTKQIFWFGDFECRGSENTLGNCRHKLLARAVHGFKKPLNVFVHCGNDTGEVACFSDRIDASINYFATTKSSGCPEREWGKPIP